MITDCPSAKVRYPTYKWAAHFATDINNRLDFRLRVFFCIECYGWHLTRARFAHRERRDQRKFIQRSDYVEQ